ncbi:MAG: 16S rRNA (cytidine(1402)-2'-O)-methyltransferase [Acidobacteriia bacterium]|nr:16S rRNA (cytidine(1402)-2'-O)-methyltransferase [Terriglobia bacterium]
MPGTLFLVSTPIGNLDDITLRAVSTLRQVAVIACEDTRHSRKLLDHLEISTPLLSCHEHNEVGRSQQLVERLLAGDSVALISDAGTPLVSDPGFRLVEAAIAVSIPVVPIPGPSAAVAALSASGLPTDAFRFAGFLPAKRTQRLKQLELLLEVEETIVFYEAPHRILDSLADIEQVLGAERPVVVARELTKLHEEFLRGTASQVHALLSARPAIKGEITLIIGKMGKMAKRTPSAGEVDLASEVDHLQSGGMPRMDAIKEVARRYNLGKRDVYKRLTPEGI